MIFLILQAVVYKQLEEIPTPELEDEHDVSSYNQNVFQNDCGNSKDCNDDYQCAEQHAQGGDEVFLIDEQQLHFSSHEELSSAYR